ncbi:MAG TPA: 2-amino-4-hydroxy-6-hydroxymethyldihydropteridine diphosphokinase [Chthoniobacterales bacterium]|jgi:2-amino-4-hydroxy-6-hydroxymethyldihydropteridine diphosphokinase|nr:2-amino-4-hydroxy-6-hydroxymethyldihydropteridine diphosphokinase [Chthoniobacterales bacterium]
MRTGIALGANLGDRFLSLTIAREMIFNLPGVLPPRLSSSIYETEPVECEPHAEKFFNAVIEVGYEGDAQTLLRELQEIERTLGRPIEHASNRSRTIDLDLLYHGPHARDEAELQLPHPRMRLRSFVLLPLSEIRPNLILPGEERTIRELSEKLSRSGSVVRAARQW